MCCCSSRPASHLPGAINVLSGKDATGGGQLQSKDRYPEYVPVGSYTYRTLPSTKVEGSCSSAHTLHALASPPDGTTSRQSSCAPGDAVLQSAALSHAHKYMYAGEAG
jgi:hypothetical protein